MSESTHASPAGCLAPSPDGDSPVLVVVVNRPADLLRAMDKKWYRIPLCHAPDRLAAEYLAFYQTGAFAQAERWLVRWLAPTRGYFLATRRDLIPEEPHHPRADDPYFRVSLGEFLALPQPIPSRRLRRITFIPTTFGRLQRAQEINDLWIRSPAQERLWEAMKLARLDAECEYPLRDDLPQCTADFALLCEKGRLAVLVSDATEEPARVKDDGAALIEYAACSAGWTLIRVSIADIERDAPTCAERLAGMAGDLGGAIDPPKSESLCT